MADRQRRSPALNSSRGATRRSRPRTTPAAADRFLKLLVAQMQNQDPLNPMDNAQVTSQMAQINTVNGIEKLNTTVRGPEPAVRADAGAAGRRAGRPRRDRCRATAWSPNDAGLVQGGFELASPADSVKVEVLNAGGRVVDTLDLGAEGGGRHGFDWTPPAGVDADAGERFRVVATSGAAAVTATPLMRDRVDAVSTGGDTLTLELRTAAASPIADQGLQLRRQGHPMSFQQGLSGLNATSKNLEVIGNNIANANTFGAKVVARRVRRRVRQLR